MISNTTIFTDIMSIFNQAITDLGLDSWQVKQAAQPVNSTITTPTIVIDVLSNPHYGWQHSQDVVTDSGITHKEILFHDMNLEATFLNHKYKSKTENAIDAAVAVSMWLNSDAGIGFIRKKGYGVGRVTEIRTGFFINESEKYERNPSFEFSLNYKQILETSVDEITKIDGYVKGV